MTQRTHNTQCVHATSDVLEYYPEKHISHMKCTWYCQKDYWIKTSGLISKVISEEEAKRALEVNNGRTGQK